MTKAKDSHASAKPHGEVTTVVGQQKPGSLALAFLKDALEREQEWNDNDMRIWNEADAEDCEERHEAEAALKDLETLMFAADSDEAELDRIEEQYLETHDENEQTADDRALDQAKTMILELVGAASEAMHSGDRGVRGATMLYKAISRAAALVKP